MNYQCALQRAVSVRRYTRILADITPAGGAPLTMRCSNSGSMLGGVGPGVGVMFSHSDDSKRQYAHTLEQMRVSRRRIGNPVLSELVSYQRVESEVPAGFKERFEGGVQSGG